MKIKKTTWIQYKWKNAFKILKMFLKYAKYKPYVFNLVNDLITFCAWKVVYCKSQTRNAKSYTILVLLTMAYIMYKYNVNEFYIFIYYKQKKKLKNTC